MDVHDSSITPSDYFPAEELRIGRKNSNWEGLMDYRTRLTRSFLGKLSAVAGQPNPSKSAEVDARFITGYAYKRSTAYHCNFANTECWYVRVHPKIESVNATSGSITGYQNLKIEGYGLNGTAVSVTVDGEPCNIKLSNFTQIQCKTGVKSSASTTSSG